MNHLSGLTRSQLKILVCIFITSLVNVSIGFENDFDFSYETNGLSSSHKNSTGIRLCHSKYLVGNCVTIEDPINECINLGILSDSKTDESSVQSLGLNGHCAHVYDNFGCEGKFMTLSSTSELQCQLALPTCRHRNRIRSLRICGAKLAPKYVHANGTGGKPCKSECETRNNSFFWCYLYDDSRDYCFPRPGQHFLIGVDCNGSNCTIPEHWESENVVLYSESSFQGKAVEVIINWDNEDCISNLGVAPKIRSVSTKDHCIKLYGEIGCNGAATRLDKFSLNFRHLSTPYYGTITSMSHCNFSLSAPYSHPMTYQGQPCITSCQTYWKPFFWCLGDMWRSKSWDYCSPRPGQDYLGRFCNTSCTIPDYSKQIQLPVLYEFPNFNGRNFTMELLSQGSRCYNFREWNVSAKSLDDMVTSIDLKGSCVNFYDDIGCMGVMAAGADAILMMRGYQPQPKAVITTRVGIGKLFGSIDSKYGLRAFMNTYIAGVTVVKQRIDTIISGLSAGAFIANDVRRPPGSKRKSGMIKSIGYCDHHFFPISPPVGSRGDRCASECTTKGNPYFWCHLEHPNAWDFCAPSSQIDYLGKFCRYCGREERPYKIALFESSSYQGNQQDVYYQSNRICHNLLETNSSSKFIPMFKHGVASLNLFGNCVQLYSGIGCIGEFVEIIPTLHDDCQDDTKECFSSSNWLSVRFCTVNFPPLCEVSVTTSGLVCMDSCKPRDNGNFSCATSNGTVEDCYPRDSVDSTGQYFCSTCKCAGGKIRFFSRSYLQGVESSTYVRRPNQCYSVANPGSVDLGDIKCIHFFHSEGCNSNVSMFLYKNDTRCQNFLQNCVSVSLNYFKLCDKFRSKGIGHRNCRTNCYRTDKHLDYFSCNVRDDIVAFCSPNSKRNHLGEACKEDNCQFNKLYPNISLYLQAHNTKINLNASMECHNLPANNTNISISDIDSFSTDLYIYDDMGCTGRFRSVFDIQKACNDNQPSCALHSNVNSIRFSHSQLPTLYHLPVALSGSLCHDGCETRNKNYFWCHVNDSWEVKCTPRPGMNFYGEICKKCLPAATSPTYTNCCPREIINIGWPGYSLVHSHSDVVVLYSGNYFTGSNLTVQNVTKRMCISFNPLALNQDFNDKAMSIALNGNCIYIYDDFGCDGEFEILRPQLNEQCHLSLSWCNRSKQISSFRHCNVTFPDKFATANGSKGLPCSNECKIRQDPNYFSCNLEDGTNDLCNPRPMQNFLLTNVSQNVTDPEFWNTNNVVVYKDAYFQGPALEIIPKNNCTNLVHTEFYRSVRSVNTKIHCIVIYKEIACTGTRWMVWSNKYLSDVKQNHGDQIASISFCDATFATTSGNITGLRGGLCRGACEPNIKPYFWCEIQNGSWDFCSPSIGRDYLGNDCNGTCAVPEFTNDLKLPVLYEHKFYHGRQFILKVSPSTTCFNLRFWNDTAQSFDRLTSSIFDNGYCLNFFWDIGCTGQWESAYNSDEISLVIDSTNINLGDLDFRYNDEIVSVNFCETNIPELYKVANGSRGATCSTECETRTKNFFWCQLHLQNAWDFCSPRIGTDYFGDDCTNDCNHSYRPHKVTLFDERRFLGHKYDIEYDQSRICHNLGQMQLNQKFQNGIASIELHGNCAVLYSDIGCTGVSTEFVPTVDEECQKDIKHCMPDKSWSSIRFCTTELPSLCPPTTGASRLRCTSECKPSGNTFKCNVKDGDSDDECFPRNGVSSTGEFTCSTCKCYQDESTILHSDVDFAGYNTVVYPNNSKCVSLDFEPFYDVNFHHKIRSVTLNGTDCIQLYAAVGCTGSFITLNKTTPCIKNIENCLDWDLCTCESIVECSCRKPHFSLRLCDTGVNADQKNDFAGNETAIFVQSVSGIPCLSTCTAPGYYFTCNISGDMQDFCRHTTEQNHFGQECLYDNCVYKKPNRIAVIDSVRNGEQHEITLNAKNNIRCYNIQNISRSLQKSFSVRDISMDTNSTCLILYHDIGCTGYGERFSETIENPCLDSLNKFCYRSFKSLRFCSSYLPSLYSISIGSTGKECQSKCDTMGESFFWCRLDDGSHDLCSPRPRLDFFGGDCDNCTDIDSTTIKDICSNVQSKKTSAFCNSGNRLPNIVAIFLILLLLLQLL